MTRDTPLIDLPVRYAVRVILLRLLAALEQARQAYLETPEPERLHDLRVAIRRVRSFVRVYREHLGGIRLKPVLRRLRRSAQATNDARDIDVLLEWLKKQTDALQPEERPALAWLCDRLEAESRASYQGARRVVKTDLKRLNKEDLARSIGRYRVEVDPESPSRELDFGPVMAGAMERSVAELLEIFAAFEDHLIFDRAHAARLLGKKLRYLVEPVVDEVPGGRAFLKQLKRLQDDLGELNDARVHAEEIAVLFEEVATAAPAGAGGEEPDPAPGLIALARLLHRRKQAAYQRLASRWLGPKARERLAGANTIIEALKPSSQLPREIERKYLLTSLPPEAARADWADLEQGYLPGNRIVERIRRITDRNGVRCFRTIKLGRGVMRVEVEEPIPQELFEELWPLTEGKRVRKRRFKVSDGSLVWEVDQFLDRQLFLAEVELPTVDVPPLPQWLLPCVQREVTGEAEYANVELAC